jgi:peptidyl-dipeptidase Dcp
MIEPTTAARPLSADNPFAAPSTLDHGTPRFDRIADEHFRPALLAGLEERADEVRTIAANSEAPTFANTIEALERCGRLLARTSAVFSSLCATDVNPQRQELQTELAPLAAAASDAIWMDAELFARVEAVHADRASLTDPEERRLVERYHTQFVRRGARLDAVAQERMRAINSELSSLSTAFNEHLRAETNDLALLVETESELAGLSKGAISAAADAARAAGHESGFLIGIELPTSQGALGQLDDRAVRQRLFEAASARCSRGNAHDTRALAIRMATLRAERAQLLGAKNHAEYVLADEMAGTPEAVQEMLAGLIPRIVARAEEEERDLRAHFATTNPGAELEPWDWAKVAEEVRSKRFDLDDDEVRQYFPLRRVLEDGVFFMARELYGIELRERTDLPVYHPDVRAWEVVEEDGTTIGLFYGDYFARASKRGGAWMTSFAQQSRLHDQLPLVVNVMNVPKPGAGQEALLSFDQVTTMFHEFGHALHGLLSQVQHPMLSGTSVPRDFVEFPSQLHEDFAFDPRVLERCAKHHETGASLPSEFVEKIRAARTYGQGFDAFEYVAAASLDLAWHTLEPGAVVEDAQAFEKTALEHLGLAHPLIPPRYRTCYFAHIFAGGYAAGYYAYLWSEALAADGFAGMQEAGGMVREAGRRAREAVLSRGLTLEPMDMYRAFRGRELDTAPLLERRGLA